MAIPLRCHQLALKRLVKYYVEALSIVWYYNYQEEPAQVLVVTDANWTGDTERRRSTSCGWVYWGKHLLDTYASTQQIVALSTAESGYIAIPGAPHMAWSCALMKLNIEVPVAVASNAKAGRAISRRGVGRVPHLDACLLRVQELPATGILRMEVRAGGGAFPRPANPAAGAILGREPTRRTWGPSIWTSSA